MRQEKVEEMTRGRGEGGEERQRVAGHKGVRRVRGRYKYCKGIIIYGNLIQGKKGLFAIRNLRALALFHAGPSVFLDSPLTMIHARKGWLFTEEISIVASPGSSNARFN